MSPHVCVVSVATAALLLTAGCSGHADRAPTGPTLESVACPDDVEVLVVPAHECGYVTAPGSTSRIFVVSVEPPEPSRLSPILETGTDLGMDPGYGGLAPIAQRTGRRVVIVDLPGTGHSTPSLDCPEVEEIGDAAAGHDESGLPAAVSACRTRLEREGVDPVELTPPRLGADLFAVMDAVGVRTWVVMGHGTTAEAGRQLALVHPDRVEALVLDSSVIDDEDAETAADRVVAAVAADCRSDDRCRERYGDLEHTWGVTERRLARTPLEVDVAGTPVAIDAAGLVRAVRWLVAPASLGPSRLPALLGEAASGVPGTYLQTFAATLSVAPPLCVGELPKCETSERLVIGAVLSAQCPTLADEPRWADVCRAWGVPAAAERVEPLHGVPTLALYGAYDPFASPEAIRDRLQDRVPDASVVEYAGGGHNVLGDECPRTLRNDWLAGDVRRPPAPIDCMTAPVDFTDS